MVITSLENKKVKDFVKLQKKKYRDSTGTFMVEGEHLVIEALKANVLKEVIILDGKSTSVSVPCTYVTYEVMKKISNMDSVPDIIGVCTKSDKNDIVGNKILLLDDIQDPGNLGTIIRSAVAFNVSTIILSSLTVDLYNSKVLWATQGMLFHINIIRMDSMDAINLLKSKGYMIYGTSVDNGVDVRSLTKNEKEKVCLIMGNEGNGVSTDILKMSDKNLYIKMNEEVESLNVGVACSILLYELER